MQMLVSDLELATATEIRWHWAAGYRATSHNNAFFYKLMKAPYITAPCTSWETPSRLPVERYHAASTDAAMWPNRDAFRKSSNAALWRRKKKRVSLMIISLHRLNEMKIEPHSSVARRGFPHWDDKSPGCTSHHHSHLKQLVQSISPRPCGPSARSHGTSLNRSGR